MILSRCRKNRGGTLLEVLVSLVILVLISSSVVEAMAQRRREKTVEDRLSSHRELAIQWRTARATHGDWSRGDTGEFPGEEHVHWKLESCEAQSNGATSPDSYWRNLVIGDNGGTTTFVIRLEPQLENSQ